jgi:hypothetical protein
MAMMKQGKDKIDAIDVYLSKHLMRKYGIIINPKKTMKLLSARLKWVLERCIEGEAIKIGNLSFRVTRMETDMIPSEKRKYYIMPFHSSAYMYTLKLSFYEQYKGCYDLNPNKETLEMLLMELNKQPDRLIRLSHNTTRIS